MKALIVNMSALVVICGALACYGVWISKDIAHWLAVISTVGIVLVVIALVVYLFSGDDDGMAVKLLGENSEK